MSWLCCIHVRIAMQGVDCMEFPLFEKMNLKFRSTPSESVSIELNKLTIIIGPNNTGKSTLLGEIHSAISDESYNPEASLVLDKCSPRILATEEADALVSRFRFNRDYRHADDGYYYYGIAKSENHSSHSHNRLVSSFSNEGSWERNNRIFTHITRLMVKMLDGQSRLSILNDAPLGDLRDARSVYSLKNAFLSDNLDEINSFVHEAFNAYLSVTSVTNAGSAVAFMTLDDPTAVGVNPKLMDSTTIGFFENGDICSEAKTQSDGTKAFLGLLLELFFSSFDILLIDEPEAFLHPTLAYLLGTAVGKCSAKKQIICSTHSVDFLRGCLDSVKELNLLRLTRDGGGSVHVFEDYDLRKMQRVPLLRTASVMNGLFFNAVVVVEGDSDEAFYREINYRLKDDPGHQSLNNALFVTSHGVDTEYKIISILRKAGIPAASIVDFDFLGKSTDVFGKLLVSANINGTLFDSFKSQKQAVLSVVSVADEDKSGVNKLNSSDAQAVLSLIEGLGSYGIFVVPNGSLESWLSCLDVQAPKDRWLGLMFDRLGDDPSSSSYVHPERNDVWEFLEKIASWVSDPDRKGMYWDD